MSKNKELAKILRDIKRILDVKGSSIYKIRAYEKAASTLEELKEDVEQIYKEKGLKGLDEIKGVGKSISQKIEEYITKGKIKYYEQIQEETAIRQIITFYFETKGLSLQEIKRDAKKRKIVYSRYTKPAKQLLELADGSVEGAKKAIKTVAEWASSRNLDYAIETVFKKWLELNKLKPKEIVKKPFYNGRPMIWSETKRKWYVISKDGDWLEFADKEDKIEWKIIK
jgi:hypothetical protein